MTKLYIDACCIIEYLRGDLGKPLSDARASEVDFTKRILNAGRNDDLEVFTSLLTVAEVTKVGDEKPDEALKRRVERLILSGRDGIKVVGLNPAISMLARDLCTDDGIKGRSADRVHLATAVYVGAKEFLTFDARLEKKIKLKEVRGCKLVTPSKSLLLPTQYRETNMFEGKGAEEKKPR